MAPYNRSGEISRSCARSRSILMSMSIGPSALLVLVHVLAVPVLVTVGLVRVVEVLLAALGPRAVELHLHLAVAELRVPEPAAFTRGPRLLAGQLEQHALL